jgi:hypothetical protein
LHESTGGTISDSNVWSSIQPNHVKCSWIITGLKPSFTLHRLMPRYEDDYISVFVCQTYDCIGSSQLVANIDYETSSPNTLTAPTGKYLKISYFSNVGVSEYSSAVAAGWQGSWTTGGAPLGVACIPCAAGKRKRSSWDGTCASCGMGVAKCVPCGVNTYSVPASEECIDCPDNTFSPGNSSICTCLPGYTGPDGSACTPCGVGTFKSATGSAGCISCGLNSFSSELASVEECAPCPTNSFSAVGSSICTCLAGYTGADGEECTPCEAGTFKESTGSWFCTPCAVGTYSLQAATSCITCPSQTSSNEGSPSLSSCTCIAGHTGDDGAACVLCTAGKYKSGTGSAACTQCPNGSSPTMSRITCKCNNGYHLTSQGR